MNVAPAVEAAKPNLEANIPPAIPNRGKGIIISRRQEEEVM